MLFSTPFFLFVFLPLFFGLYWLSGSHRAILLLGSLIFYGWSEPVFLWVVLLSSLLDWQLGRKIVPGGVRARWWVGIGIASNVGLLVYAKYTVFGLQNLNGLLKWSGAPTLSIPEILIPLGLSFIVFEKITYLVDLYRGTSAPAPTLLNYLNYVFLFPKLLAGPIVKYHEIDRQLSKPTHCHEDVREGLIRFIRGLAKKVFLADSLGAYADGAFNLPAESLDSSTAWIGLLCFTLQIYFDFSGYTDMAIGLCRVLGFRLRENFLNPYLATSFTDFWRRWHISLSSWIKEYLYIPLGGNRVSVFRSYVNLGLCFSLSGLWHGASWHFVVWGCVHGFMLMMDRAFWLRCSQKLPSPINRLLTFFLVGLSWVFFRCQDLSHSACFFKALFGTPAGSLHEVFLYPHQVFFLAVSALLILRPLWQAGIAAKEETADHIRSKPWQLAWSAILFILCVARLTVGTLEPFIYFRF